MQCNIQDIKKCDQLKAAMCCNNSVSKAKIIQLELELY